MAQQFIRQFPNQKIGVRDGVILTNRATGHVYYAYKSKTGVIVWAETGPGAVGPSGTLD